MYYYFLFIICIEVELRTPSHDATLLNQALCKHRTKKVPAQELGTEGDLKIGFTQGFPAISKQLHSQKQLSDLFTFPGPTALRTVM